MNNSISISLTSTETDDRYFLTMEQVPYETEEVDAEDTAELIDELYGTSICDTAQGFVGCGGPRDVEFSGEDPDEETFKEKVVEFLDIPSCDLIDDGSYDAQVKIYKSHQEEEYNLVVENGEAGDTVIVEETKTLFLETELSEEVQLEYPVLDVGSAKWEGSVFNKQGRITPPVISVEGNTLKWEGEATGTIKFVFDTRHDLVTVTVPPLEEGEDYENNIATLKAFYHYEMTLLETEPPAVDESLDPDQLARICGWEVEEGGTDTGGTDKCYTIKTTQTLCDCSGDIETSNDKRTTVNCPEGYSEGSQVGPRELSLSYVDCGEIDDVNDPDYYEEKCCEPWPFEKSMPKCETKIRKLTGGAEISENDVAHYRALYGDHVSFIPVGPEQGYCGLHRTHQEVRQLDCCDEVTAIEWDYDHSFELISNSDEDWVYVTGGKSPYYWEVRGSGFYVDAAFTKRDAFTEGGALKIYTDADACGPCAIYVTDGCSSVTVYVRCIIGEWESRPEFDGLAVLSGAGEGVPGFTCAGWLTRVQGKYHMEEHSGDWCSYTRGGGNDCGEMGLERCYAECGGDPSSILGTTPWQYALTGRPDGLCAGNFVNNDRLVAYYGTLYTCRCFGAGYRGTQEWVCP